MNEQMLFQRMDYMKNPNLVFEENTLYEMDPNCMRQREQDNVMSIRSSLQRDNVIHQEMEVPETLSELLPEEENAIDETILSPEQDEPVTNMFFQEKKKNRNKKPHMLCCRLLLLLLVRS